MAGPGDELAATAGRGRLRASHADREQVIGTLKAAFVQGMLDKDEFDQRLGEAFAARTHADLATVTAGLPAGLAAASRPQPVRAGGEQPVPRPGKVIAVATALYAGVWPFTLLLPWTNAEGDPPGPMTMLVLTATLIYLLVLLIAVGFAIAGWREKRSGGQLPRRPAPGAGGQASRRLPPAGPGGQLPLGGHGRPHATEAARSRRPPRGRASAETALRAS